MQAVSNNALTPHWDEREREERDILRPAELKVVASASKIFSNELTALGQTPKRELGHHAFTMTFE